ncbi:MAG: polysaccharide deacetylase family protein [Candidatus Helarchaeota archaeon]
MVKRINKICNKYNVKMTYFISTYLLENNSSFIKNFGNHHFGPHGHLHLDYSLVGKKAAYNDMKNSIIIFKNLNLETWVFRAPYAVTRIEDNPDLFFEFEKRLGIIYDSSINIQRPPWEKPPHPIKHKCGVITLPLIGVSDDHLIDNLALNDNNEILKRFVDALDYGKNGILVYDMHPIRMGQTRYIEILDAFIKIVKQRKSFKIMALKDAFSEFENKNKDDTIVCLTGDIDNLSFLDYFKRFKVS